MKMVLSIIAAHDKNRGIGIKNDLPWYLSKDLRHFKEITMDKPVIMGRNTYESILSRLKKPLPGRLNIIITSQDITESDQVKTAKSLDQAIRIAEETGTTEAFIIGGAQLYASTIDRADKLYITEIDQTFICDTFFPTYSHLFTETSRIHESENGISFAWIELERN